MAYCNPITGIPAGCDDNNLGAIKRALIGSFEDVSAITVNTVAPNIGKVTAVTKGVGKKFEEFVFKKDTSSFAEEAVIDLVADTHGWKQTVELGFRRFDLVKRNAIMLLAESRRDLIIVVEDFNGDYWMIGSDQGARLSADSSTSNNTRAGGQITTLTFTADYERYKFYKVDPTVAQGLLT